MENENQRYSRNFLVENFSSVEQNKLKNAKICIVGAGGLGGHVLQNLTAVGVGEIGIVEFDTVSISNLNRQILYKNSDIGKPKAECAKKSMIELNPEVKITIHNEKLTEENAFEIISIYDIVVDCCDNFKTRYVIDCVCEQLLTPMVHASVEGMSITATTFRYRNGKNYRTLYGEELKNRLDPPGVLSPTVAIAGSIEASEVVKLVTEIGESLDGKLLTINLKNNIYNRFNL